eukprot:2474978-Amphidinium_carterae.2
MYKHLRCSHVPGFCLGQGKGLVTLMTVGAGPARRPSHRASEKKRGPLVRPAQPGRVPVAGCCS